MIEKHKRHLVGSFDYENNWGRTSITDHFFGSVSRAENHIGLRNRFFTIGFTRCKNENYFWFNRLSIWWNKQK